MVNWWFGTTYWARNVHIYMVYLLFVMIIRLIRKKYSLNSIKIEGKYERWDTCFNVSWLFNFKWMINFYFLRWPTIYQGISSDIGDPSHTQLLFTKVRYSSPFFYHIWYVFILFFFYQIHSFMQIHVHPHIHPLI